MTDTTEGQELWTELETCLKEHDWYYMMADDNRSYRKGMNESKHIDHLMKRAKAIDEPRATRLHDEYHRGVTL